MERKTTCGFTKVVENEDLGLVETIFAVMGNIDEGGDVIHPGAFTKTISERGAKVRVLDHHQAGSIMHAIGKPIAMRELQRSELPPQLLEQFPSATGGAWARVQFLMSTPEGRGAFERIRTGIVDEWSFGYDPVVKDYSALMQDGASRTVRNLRELKLYELSPVLWGMNPATATVSAKADEGEKAKDKKPEPAQGESESDWMGRCVPKVLEDGSAESEDQAVAMCLAMFKNEPVPEKGDKEPYPWGKCMQDQEERYGDEDTARRVCGWIRENVGEYDPEMDFGKAEEELHVKPKERGKSAKAGRVLAKRNAERILRALAEINDVLKDAGVLDMESDEEAPPEKAGATPAAGPVTPPTADEQLRAIEIELYEMKLMEV